MKYYSHNIGDFDKATRHLTRIERSVYRDLIELYYDTEAMLPLDTAWLCRKIIARSDEEATAVQQALNEFFTKTPTGWFHDRCEAELDLYRANNSQKSQAGKASAAARAAKRQQAINGSSTPVAATVGTPVQQTSNGTPTNHKPITNNHKPLTNTDTGAAPVLDKSGFEEFWDAWPKSERKQDKAACKKKWEARGLGAVKSEILADVEIKKQTAKWTEAGGKYIEGPLVYINNSRWEDGVTPTGSASQPLNKQESLEAANFAAAERFAAMGDTYEV